jgi:wyosine [tRNA(Phe)-imidazoG37] synthetase (radical SAM superfamily)
MEKTKSTVFGPVPSRRLGRSVGINNIPPKICTYSCIYCQLGRTINMQVEGKEFYQPEDILHAVKDKVEQARNAGEEIDYLTFVPDWEVVNQLLVKDKLIEAAYQGHKFYLRKFGKNDKGRI